MNIESRLKNLEKAIKITSIPQSIFAKVGLMQAVLIDDGITEAQKEKLINDNKVNYFNKLAKELNTTQEQAIELYKKSGLDTEPLIIHLVS